MTQPTNFAAVGTADGAAALTRGIASDRIKDGLIACMNGHGGSTRPSYAVAGTIWYDTDVDIAYLYDGTDDHAVSPEVGSWTPALADALSGGNEANVTTADGFYVRIGTLVHIRGRLVTIDIAGSTPALTGANDAYITGLPFAGTAAAPNDHGTIVLVNSTFSGMVSAMVENGSAAFRLRESASGAFQDFVTVSELDFTNASLYFTITYMTD